MPEKLSSYRLKHHNLYFSHETISTNRPVLGLDMLATIRHWAAVEANLGRTIAAMAGMEVRAATEHLIQLRTTNPRTNFILEKASALLQPEEVEALEVLLRIFSICYRERNKLAHWLGGVCPEIEDGILLMDPIDSWRHDIHANEEREKHRAELLRFFEESRARGAMPEWRPETPWNPFPPEKILVFTTGDFARMNRDMTELERAFYLLHAVIEGGHMRDELFDRLRSLPRFQQESEIVRRKRRSTPRGVLSTLWRKAHQRLCEFLRCR